MAPEGVSDGIRVGLFCAKPPSGFDDAGLCERRKACRVGTTHRVVITGGQCATQTGRATRRRLLHTTKRKRGAETPRFPCPHFAFSRYFFCSVSSAAGAFRGQQRAHELAVGAVVDPDDALLAAGGHDAAVGADADRVEEVVVAAEVADVAAVVDVPQLAPACRRCTVTNCGVLPTNTSRVTCLLWALIVRACSPFSKSQTLTTLSAPAQASSLPSAFQPTSRTWCVWPSNDLTNLPVGHLPHLDELVGRAGGEHLAVGAEADAEDRVAVAVLDLHDQLAGAGLEDLDLAVLGRRAAAGAPAACRRARRPGRRRGRRSR